MNKLDIKKNLLDHSAAKVTLLQEYLIRYIRILSNDEYTRKIRIYDLFCGPGIFENSGEGSPIIILNVIEEFLRTQTQKKIEISCYFNDLDETKISKLKTYINGKYPSIYNSININFSSKDYQEIVSNLPKSLSNLDKEKIFIFIDPYGYKEIKASNIRSLLNSNNSEVLLFLPTQFMYRFDANGTPEALVEFIDELVDFSEYSPKDSIWKFINQLKAAFKKYIGKQYYVDTFTIQKNANSVFCLFFFCNHIRGFEKMLESKWKIDNEFGRGWSYSSNNNFNLFETPQIDSLETILLRFFNDADNKERSNAEIYEFCLREGYLPTHACDVLSDLQNSNKLVITSENVNPIKKGTFYINYDAYKTQRKFLKIRLK
ncbi:three-Cys-motif partner protein TcmP [Leptospira bourretii]|uniref:three-Cys-motif partner protein TcmP n=1 Tax=Leptospira bourretii TaxID=2484962 RepID=UPI001090E6D5|nr:three-Cys-motif partner protein TcmP [Leptospira bourretii]TGL17375.1 three-Cys-motif partner protein TcmP [Leptospira bourretii]